MSKETKFRYLFPILILLGVIAIILTYRAKAAGDAAAGLGVDFSHITIVGGILGGFAMGVGIAGGLVLRWKGD